MKTERITLESTAEFKAFLSTEARAKGISVSELVRRRFERGSDPDEQLLTSLVKELRRTVAAASHSMAEGIAAAQQVVARRRQRRSNTAATPRV